MVSVQWRSLVDHVVSSVVMVDGQCVVAFIGRPCVVSSVVMVDGQCVVAFIGRPCVVSVL